MLRKKLTPIEQASLEDMKEKLQEQGNDEDQIENIYGSFKMLLARDFIKTDRLESGEFYWQVTDDGKEFMEKYGDLFDVTQ